MPTLTLRNVPAVVIKALKDRAKENHRSMQGELIQIIESIVIKKGTLSVDDVMAQVKKLGIHSPSESVRMVREMRDGR